LNHHETPKLDTPMPNFLYRLQPVRLAMLVDGPTDSEVTIVGQHFAYLEKLVADGVVLMAGRTLNKDERTFGLVVFTTPSEAEAREIMERDPAVVKGVMTAELFPFTIALWSSKGQARLENGT
jgi:uncharacterized protein